MKVVFLVVVALLHLTMVLGEEKEKELIVKTIKEAKECTKVSYWIVSNKWRHMI